jgi:hypothetical protein
VDLATAANVPRHVPFVGSTWKVSALKLRQWATLQRWIKDEVPDPVTVALDEIARAETRGVVVSPADRQYLLAEARKEARLWPPGIGSPRWFEILDTEDGKARFVHAVLSVHQPDLTLEMARDMIDRASGAEVAPLIAAAFGVDRPPDPKAAGPGLPSSPAATNGATIMEVSSTSSPAATAGPTPTFSN